MSIIDVNSIFFAIAGGGGSSGGGGGGGGSSFHSSGASGSSLGSADSFIWALVMAAVIIAVLAALILPGQAKRRKKLEEASLKDPTWSDLPEKSEEIFRRHQIDWQDSNLSSMKKYMTPAYYAHTELMVEALHLLQRQNRVEVMNMGVRKPYVLEMQDSDQNEQDTVSVYIPSYVKDEIYDTEKLKTLYTTKTHVSQIYNFTRSGNDWLISSITQPTARLSSDIESLKLLAKNKGYFYSPDWGYLLIPVRGVLFSGASFGVSDINNHVIGKYEDVLFQVYSFARRPRNGLDDYIIAQVAIPKRYGDIVVRKKRSRLLGGIRGLTRVEMEWGEFNSRYDVFATSPEQATSFELLHPAYMSKLRDLSFEVNIEVVDNVVYLYSPVKNNKTSKSEIYETMLELLEEAFRQMRL